MMMTSTMTMKMKSPSNTKEQYRMLKIMREITTKKTMRIMIFEH